MKAKVLFRTLLLVGLLQAVAQSSSANEHAGKVVMGQISLSFYAVTGAVVRQVLERLGHTVETVQGSPERSFGL
jgi:glycine betaine/proline transport system substrate-binding protein